jgi:hypothetical protein
MADCRLAFLILAHDDPSHLARLCVALQPHSIFVHIDGKASGFQSGSISALPGVTLVRPSMDVHWGDFSVIRATLNLVTCARSSGMFDRYVLLSGGCYPVKPLASLRAAFLRSPTREWINLTPIEKGSHLAHLIGRRWRVTPLVNHAFLDGKLRAVWNKISKLAARDLRGEIEMTPYFGSQWWALTDACLAMTMEFVKQNQRVVEAYKSVYAPDEHFFHTIIGNSCFGASAIHVQDHGSATNQFMPLHLTGTAGDRYFGAEEEDDFTRIQRSNAFFIRKVSSARSAALLNRIDHELLG